MDPVSLGMDGLLVLLLLAALAVGWRLNGKLKSLKESQAGFAKAVADLDLAAGRAEAGLEALRGATLEAHDALLTRIETARTLSARLDRACEDAEAAAAKAESRARLLERVTPSPASAAAPVPAAAPPPLRLVEPARPADDDASAVLRLIESAREEAGAGAPPLPTATATAVAEDRLARFVARRREARSA